MPSSAVRELLKCWLRGGDEISGKACCELCACQEGGGITMRMQERKKICCFFDFSCLAPSGPSFGCLCVCKCGRGQMLTVWS